MHRSGTSLFTKVLSDLGLNLPGSIQPGAPDNPKGHFESLRIVQYHDELLAKKNTSWGSFEINDIGSDSDIDKEIIIKELKQILNEEFPGEGKVVLKDPRLSLFLPLWIELAEKYQLKDYHIIMLRHPVEVALSLQKRNGINRTNVFLIWMNYLFNAELASRGRKRSFVLYPDWIKAPYETISRLEKDLGVNFPEKYTKIIGEIVNKEYEPALVHYSANNESLNNHYYVENLCIKVFQNLKEFCVNPNNKKLQLEMDKLRNKFQEISYSIQEVLMGHKIKIQSLLEEVSEHKINSKLLDQANQKKEIECNRLRESICDADDKLQKLQEKLTIVKNKNSNLENENVKLIVKLEDDELAKKELEARLDNEKHNCEIYMRGFENLKNENELLSKEYERLLMNYNQEKLTVLKPIYRNIYKKIGFLLRKFVPIYMVERLKEITPNPDGVPKELSYYPHTNLKQANIIEQFDKPSTDAQPDIFIFSIINWNFRYQRPQHIAKELADSGFRVFYIEMEMSDGEHYIEKIGDQLYRVRLSLRDVGYIKSYTGKPDNSQIKKWINSFYSLCDLVKSTSFKHIVIQHPFWWQLVQHLSPEFQIVFDCMDDISGFSNTEEFILQLEEDLLKKADKVIVSSQYLFDKYKYYQVPTLIRNAADISHFQDGVAINSAPSFLFNRNSKNVIKIGYVGAIAEWFDSDLLKSVALSEPNFEFHLCGAVTAEEPAGLSKLDNVHMYGEIAYADVPGVINEMDLMIIPFKIIPIIKACDPVKFYEYSAMGKPTVTTQLPELSRAGHLAFFASTPSVFAQKVREAYKKRKSEDFQKELRDYAEQNTWQQRENQFEEVVKCLPKVSIIILSYGNPDFTVNTLHSLFDRGPVYPRMEILIVDNGSPVTNLNKIKSFSASYQNVTIIENGENLGFAKGNNVGLKAATGDYVMLLNNDTAVAPGAVYAMIRHLERNPNIGAIGPLTNNIGNEAKLFVEYENMGQMRDIARQATTGYRSVSTSINVVAYFAVMFRRQDLNVFGLIPEEYGRGMFEDDDHCAMIKSKGYICALAEDAYVHHHLSGTFSKLNNEERKELFESNMKIYEEKWGAWEPHKYREIRPVSSLGKESI